MGQILGRFCYNRYYESDSNSSSDSESASESEVSDSNSNTERERININSPRFLNLERITWAPSQTNRKVYTH